MHRTKISQLIDCQKQFSISFFNENERYRNEFDIKRCVAKKTNIKIMEEKVWFLHRRPTIAMKDIYNEKKKK